MTRCIGRVRGPSVDVWWGLTIGVLAGLFFLPALRNGFVWDDDVNLVSNPNFRGLGLVQLRWMLTTAWSTHPIWGGQWIPLTWLSFALDYLAWGLNPVGYHLTNLAIHAANAALFFVVARRLLARAVEAAGEGVLRLGAATAALFWALHPLRVESVVWATERRDVLSGFFFLLTVLTYVRATEGEGPQRRRWLTWSVGSYALAIASKATVVTLPLALLVLDAYPLGRLRGQWRARLGEKAPYLLLAAADVALTLHAARLAAPRALYRYALPARIAMALYGLWFYIEKMLFPLRLSPLYELPAAVSPLEPRFIASALAVVTITASVWLLRRRWTAGLAVWVGYGVLLAPMSGFTQIGFHLAANRYSYLPSLGPALLVGAGAGVAVAFGRRSAPACARLMLVVIATVILGQGILTASEVGAWATAETLWQSALDADPACGLCHGNLGAALEREELWEPAVPHLEAALALRPNLVAFQANLGLALFRTGRSAEAVTHFRLAIAAIPADANLRAHFGLALLAVGQPEEAHDQFRFALRLDPSNAEARANLAAQPVRPGQLGDEPNDQ
jgi:tetratricopeptide (TPR) repeat protein